METDWLSYTDNRAKAELMKLGYCNTERQCADIFTKPMKSASQFKELRRMVMNERE